MKVLFTIVSIFLSLILFSQDRVDFSGTRMSFIPPFSNPTHNPYFPVFGEEYKYEISAMEIPPGDYNTFNLQVDSVAYALAGYKVIKQSKIRVDGFPMKIVFLEAGITESYRILYGDSTFLAQITVSFFNNKEPDLGERLLNSIESIKVDRVSKIDWSKYLVIVPPKDNKFKFVDGSFYGRLLFSKSGKQISNLWDESSIIVKQIISTVPKSNLDVVSEYIADLLAIEGIEIKRTVYEGNSLVDEKKVYQFIVDCIFQGSKDMRLNVFGYFSEDYTLFLQTVALDTDDITEIELFIKEMGLK